MSFGEDTSRNYRDVRLSEMGGPGRGIDLSRHETLLPPNLSPRAKNVEFDRDSIASVGGGIKFNNQAAPRSCLEFRPDSRLTPLYFDSHLAVPLRGYGYIPYQRDTDIAGDFASEGDFKTLSEVFHNRRGRSFQLDISFEIPDEERLYPSPLNGTLSSPGNGAAWNPPHGFDEALDDCTILVQKGGDRTCPMSWAIGVVNIGAGVGLAQLPSDRISNYALVFMWLDSPGWGFSAPDIMTYNLASGALPTAGDVCTHAYRAILIHQYVEPGRSYHLALQLAIDTGTPGDSSTNTAWAHDGSFRAYVRDELGVLRSFSAIDLGLGATLSGMDVIRGPQDSAEYLCKYGIRYSGRDAVFVGLGARSFPWQVPGFIPFGSDLTALRHGGFSMVDRSAVTVTDLYGAAVHSLTATHTLGDTYVEVNHQGLTVGNVSGGLSPYGFGQWGGLGDGSPGFNPEALRGYRLVTTEDFAEGSPGPMRGAVLDIESYEESGASYRVHVRGGAVLGTWATPRPMLVQAFRWNQRVTRVAELRLWGAPRDFEDADLTLRARRRFSIGAYVDPDDETELDRDRLIAVWHMDESEGTSFGESVLGGLRTGYLAPFGLGQTEGGSEGRLTFLSGEGEGLLLDLSENPVFRREFDAALANRRDGFAVEITAVFTEAFYAIQEDEDLPDSDDGAGGKLLGARPRYVPDILTWESREQESPARTAPLLSLTHRGILASTNAVPFLRPMGFGVEFAHRTDQEDEQPVQHQDLQPFYVSGGQNFGRYDPDASWVGRRVTMQVGVQRTQPFGWQVYLAMTPKSVFRPEDGDTADGEFAYRTTGGVTYQNAGYLDGATIRIDQKQGSRPVICIGRYDCRDDLGYAEIQPRMLIEKVRVYAAPAPGRLPATNGGLVTTRDGKLQGPEALPQRKLSLSDLLLPVGPSGSTVDLQDDSATVRPSGNGSFFRGETWETSRALGRTYLYVPGDEEERREEEVFGSRQTNLYLVRSVAADGSSLELWRSYRGGARDGAVAYQVRVCGYTAFDEDIRDRPLSLGAGRSFEVGVTTLDDLIVSQELWSNVAPFDGGWSVRVYSPLGSSTLSDVLPRWVRGLNRPSAKRGTPALGLYGFNDRVLMAVQGAVHEMDDRWRHEGPSGQARSSLRFRDDGRFDHAEFTNPANSLVSGLTGANPIFYDAWVKLDSLDGVRTYFWVGSIDTTPYALAGASGHRFHMALRVTDGVPQLVIGSTASSGSPSVRPEFGLFVTAGLGPIPSGRWVHLRWALTPRAFQTILLKPRLWVMGREVETQMLQRDNNASITQPADWLMLASIVQPGAGGRVLLGASRGARLAPSRSAVFAQGAVSGRILEPEIEPGYVDGLGGELSGVFCGQAPLAFLANFDPLELDYGLVAPKFVTLFSGPGVGHQLRDEAGDQWGVIRSHPAVSLFHGLGSSGGRASFAEYGATVYVTTGGRVARLGLDGSGLAGLLEPVTAPSVDVERLPLWKPNVRDKVAPNAENDPVDGALAGADDQVNHFDNHGNNYLYALPASFTSGGTEIGFTKAAAVHSYFGFKCYFRLRSIAGRIPLFGRRSGLGKGQIFCDIVDGKIRVGWHDLYLKREVYVETSRAVVEPGYWNYINLRKRWPQADPVEGNWQNQYWSSALLRRVTLTTPSGTFQVGEAVTWGGGGDGRVVKVYGAASTTVEVLKIAAAEPEPTGTLTGVTSGATGTVSANRHPMNDLLVFRRFRKVLGTPADSFESYDVTALGVRQAVSFTTASHGIPAGTFGRGQVTTPGLRFTGGAGGGVTADYGEPFHENMVNGWFVFGDDAPEPVRGRAYLISAVNSSTNLSVIDFVGAAAPDLSGITGARGAVFMGVELVKSEGFDESTMPDDGAYPLEFFGGERGVEPLSGMGRFNGEFDSFGITCIRDDDGQDARVFENANSAVGGVDASQVGTDAFGAFISDAAGEPGELRFDPWTGGGPGANLGTWLSVHGRSYAGAGEDSSTQPNADLEVAADATPAGSANAPDNLLWGYHEAPGVFAQRRYIRARFFDRGRNVRSQPGPELLLLPESEDESNPSGQVRYRVRDIPAPALGSRQLEVELYLSAAGGSPSSLFLAAAVPAGTREVVLDPVAVDLAAGRAIDFGSLAPPRCELVQAARSRLFFGALEGQPDEIRFSRIGFPEQIDLGDGLSGVGRFRLTSGYGEKVTLLHELDGLLVVAKRRALGSVTVTDSGQAVVDLLSSGVGCVAQQSALEIDSALIFVSDRGLQLVQRAGVTNLGRPEWIGEPVEPFFRGEVDRRFLSSMSAALNRARNQYVLALRLNGRPRTNVRLSVEVTTDRKLRFGLYEDPNVTALCSVQSRDGGVELLVGGTEEGYAVWMDRSDTPHAIMSLVQAASGYAIVYTNGAGSRRGAPVLDANIKLDQALDGPRGAMLTWPVLVGTQEVLRRATALAGDTTGVLFADPVDAGDESQDNREMLVGVARRSWETPWMHFGAPEKAKVLEWVDVIAQVQSSGRVVARLYTDFNRLAEKGRGFVLSLDREEHRWPVSVEGTWFKVVLEDELDAGPAFELTDLVFRVTQIGQE